MYIKDVKRLLLEAYRKSRKFQSESSKLKAIQHYKKYLNRLTVDEIHELAESVLNRVTNF